MKELLPFERQMLLAEVYHYAWYNEEAYKDLLTFIEKYSTIIDKPVFFNPINNNDTETTNLEPLAYGQDLDTNPSFNEVQ
ncbi:hypothetical protein UFOVP614_26 [uncultured Caudovirales phage]|uniref:Uncharacterized protein n=1 Tax=uncultured Caudovirales phage TaxID=2100421 RepID=A0A6J5N5R1_9CAUD|nr:hypothetical protein UFOVP614_26 [uncultured Caudovirales phage]